MKTNVLDQIDSERKTTRTMNENNNRICSKTAGINDYSESRLMGAIVELLCYEIITMTQSNSDGSTSTTSSSKLVSMKDMWNKRMKKIKEVRRCFNTEIKLKGTYGRLYCNYMVIHFLEYLHQIFYTNNLLIQPTVDEESLQRNSTINTDHMVKCDWLELNQKLEEIKILLMHPKASVVVLPRIRHNVDNNVERNEGNQEDKDTEGEIDLTEELEARMKPYSKDHDFIKSKLLNLLFIAKSIDDGITEIDQVKKNNEGLFDYTSLLEQIDTLVQRWYKVCIPLPQMNPQKYIHFSLIQLHHTRNLQRSASNSVCNEIYNEIYDNDHFPKATTIAQLERLR